ncbi:MAG: hypothetical protein HRT35_24800, partial [Algicola sp.]|nr:hypothetical protein [Algicola sp.]
WGVELAKPLAEKIQKEINHDVEVGEHDSSTASLIAYYKSIKAEL